MKEIYIVNFAVTREDDSIDTAGAILIGDTDSDENMLIESAKQLLLEQSTVVIKEILAANVLAMDNNTLIGVALVARMKGLL